MKKFFKVAILGVIAAATLALAIPMPESLACVRCIYGPCPPCTRRGAQTCWQCARCVAIPECGPN